MARSEGGLCGFPIYRHTTTAPKTSECSSIVSMQYVWKIVVISIFSNTNTFKKFFLKKPNTIHAIHQTLLPEYTIPSTPAVWNLRFRSSGKLARFYSSLTHHWMLFFFSACTWTSRTHNNLMILGTELSSGFPPQCLQISPNQQQHNNVDSQQNQNHFKNQPNLG